LMTACKCRVVFYTVSTQKRVMRPVPSF
jgi:hypothetical protein